MELPGLPDLPAGRIAGDWRGGVGLCTQPQLDEVCRLVLRTVNSIGALVPGQSHGGGLVKMLNEKTTQKVLFVWLIFLLLLSTRVLLVTKAGALLMSLLIVAFSIWVAFRLVESVVAAAWKISGVIARRLVQKPAEAHSAEHKGIGE